MFHLLYYTESYIGLKREKVILSITRCPASVQADYGLPKFNVGDAKAECTFHSQGLDRDIEGHKVTVTGKIQLPRSARNADSIYVQPSCTFKLSAYVYEGPAEKKKLIGEASEARILTDEEQESLMVHMTIHSVVGHEDIFYSKRCPEKIFIRVTTELMH